VAAIVQGGKLAAVMMLGGAAFALAGTGKDVLTGFAWRITDPPTTAMDRLEKHIVWSAVFFGSLGFVIGALFAAVPPLAVNGVRRLGNGVLIGGLTGGIALSAYAWASMQLHPDVKLKFGPTGSVIFVECFGTLAGGIVGAIAGTAFGAMRQSAETAMRWVVLWMLFLGVLFGSN
jgi:hypothetical protein